MRVTDHPLYRRYRNMKERCSNPKHKDYADYGGRGITVCDQWLVRGKGFWQFVEDMGECPTGFELDRVDNNDSYSPQNCRWAARAQQQRNTRSRKSQVPFRWVTRSGPRFVGRFRMPDDYSAQVYAGTFSTPEEAHLAAVAKRLELYWRI